MYHQYKTAGIILASYEQGEASKMLVLLTSQFGVLRAHVQSVRFLRSKMRYHAQAFNHARFGLIRGRHNWKIVQIADSEDMLGCFRHSPEKMQAIKSIGALILRLCQGEGEEGVYAVIRGAVQAIAQAGDDNTIDVIVQITALRLLCVLGYPTDDTSIAPLVSDLYAWDSGSITQAMQKQNIFEKEIQKITELTHL